MMFQEFERSPVWQFIADIMSWLLSVFKPIVYPIGYVMVIWIDFLLQFFPSDNIIIYIVIFCILVVSGIYVNIRWPGEQYERVYTQEDGEDSGISHLKKKEEEEPSLE